MKTRLFFPPPLCVACRPEDFVEPGKASVACSCIQALHAAAFLESPAPPPSLENLLNLYQEGTRLQDEVGDNDADAKLLSRAIMMTTVITTMLNDG